MTLSVQNVISVPEDAGCHYSNSCLSCPFPKCIEDMLPKELHDFIYNNNLPKVPKRAHQIPRIRDYSKIKPKCACGEENPENFYPKQPYVCKKCCLKYHNEYMKRRNLVSV